jgi:hypothetical protein
MFAGDSVGSSPVSERSERALYVPLQRCLAGFHLTDLVRNVRAGGPHTLIAPIDRAFDRLPWSFDQLIADDALIHPRFDLFEYFAVVGACDADAPLETFLTLQGEKIRIGCGLVIGREGVARILATTEWKGIQVHAVDACVMPSTFFDFAKLPS